MAQSFLYQSTSLDKLLYKVKRSQGHHGNYCQASFHHAHMIRVRYFDNLICGRTGAWVLPLHGQASHL